MGLVTLELRQSGRSWPAAEEDGGGMSRASGWVLVVFAIAAGAALVGFLYHLHSNNRCLVTRSCYARVMLVLC